MYKKEQFLNNPNKGALENKSSALSFRVIKLCQFLREDKREYVISKQLLKAGTNPGAMVREAQFAQSGKDFINKLEIAQKETAETMYWLELLFVTNYINQKEFGSIYEDTKEIMRLLTSIIKTRKKNLSAPTNL